MLTCIIRYQIDPTKKAQFEQYAHNWGQGAAFDTVNGSYLVHWTDSGAGVNAAAELDPVALQQVYPGQGVFDEAGVFFLRRLQQRFVQQVLLDRLLQLAVDAGKIRGFFTHLAL